MSYQYSAPDDGATHDPTFRHRKCFNTFGEPSGYPLTNITQISMVEGYSFEGRARLSLATLPLPVDDHIPASCATTGSLASENGSSYDLEACGLPTATERLKACAALCTHVDSCVAGELSRRDGSTELTRCELHGGDGFDTPNQRKLLPGTCQEFPQESHSDCSSRSVEAVFVTTICPASPVDANIYTERRLYDPATHARPPYNPNFYRLGNFMKVEYLGIIEDSQKFVENVDPDGIWAFCKHIMVPAKAAIFSQPEFTHTSEQHIVCGGNGFDGYKDSAVAAGTFGLWFTVDELRLHEVQGVLEDMACRKTADCTSAVLRRIEATLGQQLGRSNVSVVYVSESMAQIDSSYMMPVANFTTTDGQCFDTNGNGIGSEIRPGFTAAIAKQRQMVPENHADVPTLFWSDFDPQTDYYPVPRGCFADTTQYGTPSNPSFQRGNLHITLLGPECVGNRTEEQMLKICLTICSHTSYGGPGTIDDRCIGVNYDEHGWAGHCHLQRSSLAVPFASETCSLEPDKEDVMGLCMQEPQLTYRETCIRMDLNGVTFSGDIEAVRPYDWCGTVNYIAFWCSVAGANGAMPGPHVGRNCPTGTEWDDAAVQCVACPIHTYSVLVRDPNLSFDQPRARDMPSLINSCAACPVGRMCPGATGCANGDNTAECPPPISCDPGRYWSPEPVACLPCPADTYKVGTNNQTACVACPAGSYTINSTLGSTSPANCTPPSPPPPNVPWPPSQPELKDAPGSDNKINSAGAALWALLPVCILLITALVGLYRRHSRLSRDQANLRISRDRANVDLQIMAHKVQRTSGDETPEQTGSTPDSLPARIRTSVPPSYHSLPPGPPSSGPMSSSGLSEGVSVSWVEADCQISEVCDGDVVSSVVVPTPTINLAASASARSSIPPVAVPDSVQRSPLGTQQRWLREKELASLAEELEEWLEEGPYTILPPMEFSHHAALEKGVGAAPPQLPATSPPAKQTQVIKVKVPQGMHGGMPLQVKALGGVMQVQIPPGLQPGMTFQFQAPVASDGVTPQLSFAPFRATNLTTNHLVPPERPAPVVPAHFQQPRPAKNAKNARKNPRNASYQNFCQKHRPSLPAGLRNADREKVLGQMWKALSKTEKAKYAVEEGPAPAPVCVPVPAPLGNSRAPPGAPPAPPPPLLPFALPPSVPPPRTVLPPPPVSPATSSSSVDEVMDSRPDDLGRFWEIQYNLRAEERAVATPSAAKKAKVAVGSA